MANLTATMADLDTYKDKVIVFEAVKASDTSRLATRQPLKTTTNTHVLSPPKENSYKPVDIKASLESASDENHDPPSAMSRGSLHPSKVMPGYSGSQSNIHSPSPLSDRMPQSPLFHPHTSGSTFRSSNVPHASVRSRLTPHSRDTTPLSTSDHASGSVDMAGFDRYCASWHDRLQVSYLDYDDGTHALGF